MGELLSGKTINDHLRVYGDAHEAELWRSFSMAMNGSDLSLWLYNGGAASGTDGRPADLGYYVGARITAAYFDKQTNKKQALRDILTIRDFGQFLNARGYAAKFAR